MSAALKCSWRHAGLLVALLITSCVDSTAPVLDHAPASIEISGSSEVQVGSQVKLTATIKDGLGSAVSRYEVVWSSSNPGVASVTSWGTVYGQSVGSAEISARVDGFPAVVASAQITVIPPPVASVEISPPGGTIAMGGTVQLTAITRDASGNTLTNRAVTWSSSDNTVASVSASGLVRGVSAGSVTITATSEGKSGTASFMIVAGSGSFNIAITALVQSFGWNASDQKWECSYVLTASATGGQAGESATWLPGELEWTLPSGYKATTDVSANWWGDMRIETGQTQSSGRLASWSGQTSGYNLTYRFNWSGPDGSQRLSTVFVGCR